MNTAGTVIAIIGIGNMGLPMARRLLAANYPVVGFDISAEARGRFAVAGGVPAASAAEAGAGADIVILMLPSSDTVESVLEADGVLAAARPGALIVDMSSSEPLRTRGLAERIAGTGLHFIDAPVSGGVSGAIAGTLTIMAGGPAGEIARAEPVLSHLGKVTRIGTVGSGHALKALNNLMSAAHLWISCEALAAAEAFGIDPATMVEVVNRSTGRSASTERKLPQFVLTESFDSGFALRLMVKDIAIAAGLATQLGTDHRLADETLRRWASAADQLPATADHTEIARVLRKPTR